MSRSFVQPRSNHQTLKNLPPSSPDQIRAMAAAAGLVLPEKIMLELIESFPAFEAMVRRLPRSRSYFDDSAHTFAAAVTEPKPKE